MSRKPYVCRIAFNDPAFLQPPVLFGTGDTPSEARLDALGRMDSESPYTDDEILSESIGARALYPELSCNRLSRRFYI